MKFSSRAHYLRSLSLELESQSARIRNLIGDAHWLTDGHHKELLLRDLIQKHCPASVIVTSGFVLSSTNDLLCSTEQDILIIDVSREAPVFRQGDVSIAFPNSIIAAISVKSEMTSGSIASTVKGLASVRNVARECSVPPERIWCAGFFYEIADEYQSEPSKLYQIMKRYIYKYPAKRPIIPHGVPSKIGPDAISDAKELAFLFDRRESFEEESEGQIRGYGCNGAATAVFLGELLEHVTWFVSGDRSTFSDFLVDLKTSHLDPPSYKLGGIAAQASDNEGPEDECVDKLSTAPGNVD